MCLVAMPRMHSEQQLNSAMPCSQWLAPIDSEAIDPQLYWCWTAVGWTTKSKTHLPQAKTTVELLEKARHHLDTISEELDKTQVNTLAQLFMILNPAIISTGFVSTGAPRLEAAAIDRDMLVSLLFLAQAFGCLAPVAPGIPTLGSVPHSTRL